MYNKNNNKMTIIIIHKQIKIVIKIIMVQKLIEMKIY